MNDAVRYLLVLFTCKLCVFSVQAGGVVVADSKTLNEVFTEVADHAGYTYFPNTRLKKDIITLGHSVGPYETGEEWVKAAGLFAAEQELTLYTYGNTMYVLTEEQLNEAPRRTLKLHLLVKVEGTEKLVVSELRGLLNGTTYQVVYDEKSGLLFLEYRFDREEKLLEVLKEHVYLATGRSDEELSVEPQKEVEDWQFQDRPMNYIASKIAERAGLEFEMNPLMEGDWFKVSGNLEVAKGEKAVAQLESLAFNRGANFFIKGNRCYMLTQDQCQELGMQKFTWMLASIHPGACQKVTKELNEILKSRVGKATLNDSCTSIHLMGKHDELEKAVQYLLSDDIKREVR